MAGENNSPQGQGAPQNQAAPGQQGFDGQQQQAQSSHMPPPPLPPVIIPQNSNPLPQAITSPMSGVTSPTSAGGFVRRAAPEPNKRALYVGGLDPRVTEEILKQIFETTGHVQSVKIIPDKNVSNPYPPLIRHLHVFPMWIADSPSLMFEVDQC